MCLLCWITLQQEHQFSLECLLKLSALLGSTVRGLKQTIPVFMVGKADTILAPWWEICWYRSAVPQPVTLLLDQRTQSLVGLWPLMVLASSVSVHVSAGDQNVRQSLLESTPALTAACVTSVCAQRWRDSHTQKIAAEEQAIPVWHQQQSAV